MINYFSFLILLKRFPDETKWFWMEKGWENLKCYGKVRETFFFNEEHVFKKARYKDLF